MFLTQHIDRDPERNLLKGRRCIIEDWVLDELEVEGDKDAREVVLTRPPVCVIVSFPGATWQLPGMAPGMYPIQVCKKDWYVDQKQSQAPSYSQAVAIVPRICGHSKLCAGSEFR